MHTYIICIHTYMIYHCIYISIILLVATVSAPIRLRSGHKGSVPSTRFGYVSAVCLAGKFHHDLIGLSHWESLVYLWEIIPFYGLNLD